MLKRILLAGMAGLLMIISAAGCSSGASSAAPTTNPTLLAIMVMLTQTAAAPTITVTPTGTPPAPKATPLAEETADGILNQTVTLHSTALTVLSAKLVNEAEKNKPLQGRAYLQVEVYLKNLASEAPNQTYSPYYFSVRDAGGNMYMPQGFSVIPRLLGGELRPGEIVRGNVLFEVPADGTGFSLRYAVPVADGSIPASLVVDLNQDSGAPPAELSSVDPTPWFDDALPKRDKVAEGPGYWTKIDDVKKTNNVRGESAPAGWMYLVLHGMIKNTQDKEKLTYNAQYFKVKDELGYEYAPMVLTGKEYLGAGSIPGDMTDEGELVFLVPERVTKVGVMYQPQVIGASLPEVRMVIRIP